LDTQIATVRDGKVGLFATVEHWNAEALGWHVSNRGTRREALQATSIAVRHQFGHLSRDVARGVQLRHDHGSSFMADDFQTQIRAWGVTPSFAFVGQPETKGVVERFFRTFKEQIVHGRVYETIEDVREVSSPATTPNGWSRRTATFRASLVEREAVVFIKSQPCGRLNVNFGHPFRTGAFE
jgi:transposase InsO family protein